MQGNHEWSQGDSFEKKQISPQAGTKQMPFSPRLSSGCVLLGAMFVSVMQNKADTSTFSLRGPVEKKYELVRVTFERRTFAPSIDMHRHKTTKLTLQLGGVCFRRISATSPDLLPVTPFVSAGTQECFAFSRSLVPNFQLHTRRRFSECFGHCVHSSRFLWWWWWWWWWWWCWWWWQGAWGWHPVTFLLKQKSLTCSFRSSQRRFRIPACAALQLFSSHLSSIYYHKVTRPPLLVVNVMKVAFFSRPFGDFVCYQLVVETH